MERKEESGELKEQLLKLIGSIDNEEALKMIYAYSKPLATADASEYMQTVYDDPEKLALRSTLIGKGQTELVQLMDRLPDREACERICDIILKS